MRNLVSRWCFLALLFVPLATSTAWAQTFTGGVRGVVHRLRRRRPRRDRHADQRSQRRHARCGLERTAASTTSPPCPRAPTP